MIDYQRSQPVDDPQLLLLLLDKAVAGRREMQTTPRKVDTRIES